MLSGYCDANWTSDRDNRKLTTRFCIWLERVRIAWNFQTQPLVATSTTEAEFFTLREGLRWVLWVQKLLEKFDSTQIKPLAINEDNQETLVWGISGIRNTKHVSVRRSFVRHLVAESDMQLAYATLRE